MFARMVVSLPFACHLGLCIMTDINAFCPDNRHGHFALMTKHGHFCPDDKHGHFCCDVTLPWWQTWTLCHDDRHGHFSCDDRHDHFAMMTDMVTFALITERSVCPNNRYGHFCPQWKTLPLCHDDRHVSIALMKYSPFAPMTIMTPLSWWQTYPICPDSRHG